MHKKIFQEIYSKRNSVQADILKRFFKTGKGEYGEGDLFLGVKVPVIRKIVSAFKDASFEDAQGLLTNKFHEARFAGVLVLINLYRKAGVKEKKRIALFYANRAKSINSWDLVDVSSPHILGDFLFNHLDKKEAKKFLIKMSLSKNLWKQRKAMVASLCFIKNGKLDIVFRLAKIFLSHKHHLMHKATGWMLREAGKKNKLKLKSFLSDFSLEMPCVMLTYSMEKLSKKERIFYRKKDF